MKITKDQARGMLVGKAVGDALGAPLEFEPKCRELNNLVTDMIGGGPHRVEAGEWTDDTAMALALADAINEKGVDYMKAIENFHKWYKKGEFQSRGSLFDIGITTQEAITRYSKDKTTAFHGSTSEQSSGNGGIMRMAPVIIANHLNLENTIRDSELQSKLTHASKTSLLYAKILAEELWQGEPLDKYKSYKLPTDTEREKVMSGGYIKETYECSWWSIQNSDNSFEKAVINAINLGHDTDTSGAVTGMIAGRLWGYSSIPQRWLKVLHWKDKIISEADRLYSLNLN